jgi:hypothetical protein
MQAAKAAFLFSAIRAGDTWVLILKVVDDADRLIVDRTRALFDRIFPGFTVRLERIDGMYRPSDPYRHVKASQVHPEGIHLSLRYLAKARRGVDIKVRLFAEKHPDEWKIVENCYHFGPDPLSSSDEANTHLRICRNGKWPHHFHLRGLERAYNGGHIPLQNANPPLKIDPFSFLELVEQFIETNKIPIGVKP